MGVAGYALAAQEHHDRAARHAHVPVGPGVVAWYRVVVAVDLDVVVDADRGIVTLEVFGVGLDVAG